MVFVSYVWVLFVVLCCDVMQCSVVGVVIFVLSVTRVVGGVPLWIVCVFRRVFVSVVHPVTILSAVFCVICSLLVFVSDAIGDHDSWNCTRCMGFVMTLYVARIVFFCSPHVVDVSALSICIVLRAFVVCEFGVESQS